jgi:hypothetical protein
MGADGDEERRAPATFARLDGKARSSRRAAARRSSTTIG